MNTRKYDAMLFQLNIFSNTEDKIKSRSDELEISCDQTTSFLLMNNQA